MATQTITLTPAALAHVQKMQEKQNQGNILRLSIKKTGCSGFSYVMSFVSVVDPEDPVFPQSDGRILCVDKETYPLIRGLVVDYIRKGLNETFQYQNPNAAGECGCGESFNV